MDYRMLLTQNADQIIYNNQAIAIGNCSDISPILNTRPLGPVPYLFSSITTPPHIEDNPSDLKDTYLKKYISTSGMASIGLRY
jgi:hypothetical protein